MHNIDSRDKQTVITVFYVTLIIASNLMATKLTSVRGWVLPSAVIIYPFTFLLGDVMTEIWGFKVARKIVWLGFGANAVVVLTTTIGVYLPYPEFWHGQAHYAFIFGFMPRVVLGSFLGYLAGEMTNVWAMDAIKKATGADCCLSARLAPVPSAKSSTQYCLLPWRFMAR